MSEWWHEHNVIYFRFRFYKLLFNIGQSLKTIEIVTYFLYCEFVHWTTLYFCQEHGVEVTAEEVILYFSSKASPYKEA